MKIPVGIIAGVSKAGTTAVFNALAAQPHIAPSRKKESHFFSAVRYGGETGTLAGYGEVFLDEPRAQLALEATPSYFYGGERVARAINGMLPEARIVVVLREPGARAYSWWRFSRSRLWIPPGMDFPEYLERCAALEVDPESTKDLLGWRGLSGGLYSKYLPSWQAEFGHRLLVIFHDDVTSDFGGSLQRIGAHMGVDVSEVEADRTDNITTDVKNTSLQRMALKVNDAGELLWRRLPRAKKRIRQMYYSINSSRQQEKLSAESREWLRRYYADEVSALRALVSGIDGCPSWLTGKS